MIVLEHIHPQNFHDGTGYKISEGKYWLGDPSYFLDKSLYEKVLSTKFYEDEDYCAGKFDENMIVAMRTAYGDGTYFDNEDNSYDVDSGMVALIHESFQNSDSKTFNGRWLNLDDDSIFVKDNFGVFLLTSKDERIIIDTAM